MLPSTLQLQKIRTDETHPRFFLRFLKPQQWLGYVRLATVRCLKVLMGGSFLRAQASRAFSSRTESIPVVGREVIPVWDTSLKDRWGIKDLNFG